MASAMNSMRNKEGFYHKKTGRKLQFDAKEPNDENYGFSWLAMSPGSVTQVTSCSNECKESYANLKRLYDGQREELSDASVEIKAYTQGLKKVEAQLVAHQQGQLWELFCPHGPEIEIDDSQYTIWSQAKTQPIESESKTTELDTETLTIKKQANLALACQQESNQNTGTKDKIGAGDSDKVVETEQDCFELPIWHSYSSTKKGSPREEEQVFLDDLARLQMQEKEANEEAEALRKNLEQETENLVTKAEAAKSSSTNIFSTVSTTAKASGTNLVNTVSIPVSTASSKTTSSQEDDSEIPPLEDIHEDATDGIFTHSSYDDEGAVADFTNLETVVNVSPIPTSKINPSHPSALILGDPTSAVQTRSKVNKSSEAHAFVSYIQKQRRNNHKDFHHCLFACFLSQHEPKKISKSLEDDKQGDAYARRIIPEQGNPQQECVNFLVQETYYLARCKKQTIVGPTSTTEAEYVAAFEHFGATAKLQNRSYNVRYITAKVAGKVVSISEASIRTDLIFDDADGIDPLLNQAIFNAI
ncbi:hypothetical protein Tco_1183244 [Tanacetum coccineum]